MAKKDRIFWINRGWQPVYIGFCPTAAAWSHQMAKWKATDDFPDTDGRATTFAVKGKTCVVVTLREGVEGKHCVAEIAGLLVHEATHVWQAVRDHMGEASPSIEFEAYAMQSIFQGLYQGWRDTRGHLMPKGAT